MAGIQILRTHLTLTVTVPLEQLRREMGEPVLAIGPTLAGEVDQYVREHKLGYYPALDYFIQKQALDMDLVAAAEHVAAMVAETARRKIQTRLREPFSNIKFANIQSVAMTLPRVRPGDANALNSLTQHYSPNRIRIGVIASSIEKAGINTEDYNKLAAHKMRNWLEPEFESVDITESHQMDAAD
ncbi:MAG: hypothetical protein OEZ10_09835 [Gammaproteobacteria bacterium]|nr:hypothetical protein [Gammaproteobacteria bacterium]